MLPVVLAAVPGHTPSEILEEVDSRIIAFRLSFAVVARFWFSHHPSFERIATYDSRLIWGRWHRRYGQDLPLLTG